MHLKVALVLPQGCSTEAPQNQVLVHVVPGFLDGDVLEQAEVFTQDVVCPGPHLLVA